MPIRFTRPFGTWGRCGRVLLVAITVATWSGPSAWALITGGEGNDPIRDPGWPQGAAAVFNTTSRVAYWEGPPFGGGQWHAECRGDAAALSQVLKDFAQVDIPTRRVVLHDGLGVSFWLNPNRDKNKEADARIDWTFMVWRPESLKFQRNLPPDFRGVRGADDVVLAQIDVYVSGNVRWTDVILPVGLDVIDQRLEAHGYSENDGTVLEGRVVDIATQQPLSARLQLEQIEHDPDQRGYRYTKLVQVDSDREGHWVLKNAPAVHCRLVLSAENYASRVIGYHHFDGQPRWSEHNAGLSKSATLTGRVVDDKGSPLSEVDVRMGHLSAGDDERYELAIGSTARTDANGRFEIPSLPTGSGTLHVHKDGYVRPGLGQKTEIPAADVTLEMLPSATLTVRVDFSKTTRPAGYIVHVEPEGGEAVGKWSGSGNIDAAGQITYRHIPPGKYVVTGRPNPGSDKEQTEPTTLDLTGGVTTEISIQAK